MDSIIRQLIIEYTAKGMTLVDILEKQIEPEHPAREFIRVYKSMYPSKTPDYPSPTKELLPTEPQAIQKSTHRPAIHGKGRQKIFACVNGYFDLVDCKFIPTPTMDVKKLSSKNIYPPSRYDMQRYYDYEAGLTKFLEQVFPDPDIREYVLNIYAESLDGVRRREEFFIHIGSGGNGKSVFLNLLQHTFGDYYKFSDIMTYSGAIPSDTRIIMFPEPRVEKGIDASIVKDICQYHNAGLMCTDLPDIGSTDNGTWRKIHVINYPSRFVLEQSFMLHDSATYPNHYPRDYDILEKVKLWAPHFLQMLFERYKTLKANEFKSLNDEFIPIAVRDATDRYRGIDSFLELFAKECTEDKPGYKQSADDVWEAFQRYVAEHKYQSRYSRKQFDIQIKRFMGDPRTIGGEQVFIDRTLCGKGVHISA
jgi:putative DNA primase/helicase